MSDASLLALAADAGLIVDWEDAQGRPQRVSPESLRMILSAMGLSCSTARQCEESRRELGGSGDSSFVTADVGQPVVLPKTGSGGAARLTLDNGDVQALRLSEQEGSWRLLPIGRPGYHRLEMGGRQWTIAVAPPHCFTVEDVTPGRRPWGLAVQLYALRGERPAAFGDFAALADFAMAAGARGADAVAISPVHALFAADPGRYSPYSPSSRLFLNPMFADPLLCGSDGGKEEEQGGALIDWMQASPARMAALRRLFERIITENGADSASVRAFAAEGGEDLERHARFEALHAYFLGKDGVHGWQGWPAEYHDPEGPDVSAFAAAHRQEVDFHIFLQWLADKSLGRAQAAARASGMAIGLISDIAVGLDRGGSEAWSRRDTLLAGLSIGAPPDAFQAAGQNWGITGFSPQGLQATGFAPFIATLRTAMRHAGGVRIDHALGLRRLWVVPEGASPLEGAYMRCPEQDLLRLVALESHRARAIVIGEDLGVVPAGFRDMIAARGLMGMRVLPFERDAADRFTPPDQWHSNAVAMTSTHDLPPVAGWWRGRDIEWREKLASPGDRVVEAGARAEDRRCFWQAAKAAGIARAPQPPADDPAPAVDAAIAYVAQAACDLALVPVEDLLGLDEAPNMPGIVDRHPNWRRRLDDAPARLFSRGEVAGHIATLNKARR